MDVYSIPSRHAPVRMLHLRILIAKSLRECPDTRRRRHVAAGAPCLRCSSCPCAILSVRKMRAAPAMLTPFVDANSHPPSRRGRRRLGRALKTIGMPIICLCLGIVCAAATPRRNIDEQLQDDRHNLRQSREQLERQHQYEHAKRQSRGRRC